MHEESLIKRIGNDHNHNNDNHKTNNILNSTTNTTMNQEEIDSIQREKEREQEIIERKKKYDKKHPLGRWEPIVVQVSYVIVHIIIYLVLMFRNGTDLNHAIFVKPDIFYLVWTHSVFLFTFITYFNCARTPTGYIGNGNNEISLESLDGIRGNIKEQSSNSMNNNINDNNNSNQDNDDNEMDRLLDHQEQIDKYQHLLYCKICDHMIPLRSRHCNRCNKCVVKFDHHCFFVGKCIGVLNHRNFILFLIAQGALLLLGLQIAITGFKSESNIADWLKSNIFLLPPTMIIFATMFMPVGLFLFHSYLVVTEQTSWEATKRSKITYLKNLKGVRYPFSKDSIFQNIRSFWNDYNGVFKWSLPTPSQLQDIKRKKETTFNFWNNKYYSCC